MFANKQSDVRVLVYRGCILQCGRTYFNWFVIERGGGFTLVSHVTLASLFTLFVSFFFFGITYSTNNNNTTAQFAANRNCLKRGKRRKGEKANEIESAVERSTIDGVGSSRSAPPFWVIRTVGRLPTNWGDCDAIRSFKGRRRRRQRRLPKHSSADKDNDTKMGDSALCGLAGKTTRAYTQCDTRA